MDNGRQQFLFGITVSEVAFILFFILLLFSFFTVSKLEKDNTREREGRAEAAESLRQIGEAFGRGAEIDPEEALMILKKGADAVERAQKQAQQLQELRADSKRLQEMEHFARQEANKSQEELRLTKGQLAKTAQMLKKDKPPCWVMSERGELDFIFDVRLFGDETIKVDRAASKMRDSEYLAMPSVPEITSRRLSLKEFERLALPIYQQSVESELECRHWVKLNFDDRAACSYMLVVENFFYKSVRKIDNTICPQ